MANNRMYLVHRPTGMAVCLGKRMGWGWYKGPAPGAVERLYERAAKEAEGDQDDYVLLWEDAPPGGLEIGRDALECDRPDVGGLRRFRFSAPAPATSPPTPLTPTSSPAEAAAVAEHMRLREGQPYASAPPASLPCSECGGTGVVSVDPETHVATFCEACERRGWVMGGERG